MKQHEGYEGTKLVEVVTPVGSESPIGGDVHENAIIDDIEMDHQYIWLGLQNHIVADTNPEVIGSIDNKLIAEIFNENVIEDNKPKYQMLETATFDGDNKDNKQQNTQIIDVDEFDKQEQEKEPLEEVQYIEQKHNLPFNVYTIQEFETKMLPNKNQRYIKLQDLAQIFEEFASDLE